VIDLVPWQAVLPIRHQVLRPGRPPQTAQFDEDGDPDTFHVAAHDINGAVIGCATFFPGPLDDEPAWLLRGMATLPGYRGQGVGGQVLEAGVAEVLRRGGAMLWCKGRVAAAEFYRRHGFVSRGEQFSLEPNGPHYVFVRNLDASALR
jgi:GNAT superfamily N-acetyltransferase